MDKLQRIIKQKQAEAVQKFAEKLKDKTWQGYQVGMFIVDCKTIDETVKEYIEQK